MLEALERKHSSEMSILMKLSSNADDTDYVEQGLYINNVVSKCGAHVYGINTIKDGKT